VETDKIKKGERLDRWAADKYRICMHRIDHDETYSQRVISQGAIYTCEFGENIGYEQGRPINEKRRPALVISNNHHNRKSATVVVLPLSTKIKRFTITDNGVKKPVLSSQYFLYKSRYPFLSDDSVVKVDKIREVDKIRLDALMGNITKYDLNNILKRLEWLTKIF